MEVQLLNEQEIEIPGDLDAPVQVLVLAFEMESQKYVDPWTAYFRDSLQTDGPEVRYLEVPMISGAYRMVSGFINGGMRDGIDTGLHNNVGTFFGNRSPYFESLKMADREAVYLFVLDRKGIIRYSCISPKTPQKTRAVAETIETILEPSLPE